MERESEHVVRRIPLRPRRTSASSIGPGVGKRVSPAREVVLSDVEAGRSERSERIHGGGVQSAGEGSDEKDPERTERNGARVCAVSGFIGGAGAMSFLSYGRVKTAAMNTIAGGQLPIAIDFGASALKVLQLAAGDTPTLVAAAALETPEALVNDHVKRFQFQCQALPRLIKAGRFKGKRAVCAIPAGQMFCKHMQFPRNDSVTLDEMVQTGVPAALEVSPEAVVLKHYLVEGAQTPGSMSAGNQTGGIKQEVICLAVGRELVHRLMGAIRESRLEPVGIQPECIATIRAFDHIHRRVGDDHVSTLYIDLAFASTKVWITHGKSLVFGKVINAGGKELDLTVSRALNVSLSEARMRRLASTVEIAPATPATQPMGLAREGAAAAVGVAHNFLSALGVGGGLAGGAGAQTAEERRTGQNAPGLTPSLQSQEQAAVGPPEFDLQVPLESLTDEIAMCLRYHEAMFPGRRIDRAVFFGGEARHRGLCQVIARRVRATAHVADPVARIARTGKEPCVGVDFSTPQPGWTIPFGLAHCPTDL